MRTLILGTAPQTPLDSLYIFAGPWCFAAAPDELEKSHTYPAEPFANPEHLATAVLQGQRLLAVAAENLAVRLNTHHGTQLSAAFWDTALAPWLCTAVEVLIDRLWRLDALITEHGETPLRVPLPANEAPLFANTRDFMLRGVLDPFWNHWLFARLVQNRIPPAWKPEGLVADIPLPPAPASGQLLRRMAKRLLFGLPFPRIKGFSTGQSLRLSLILMSNRNSDDRTLPLAAFKPENDPPELSVDDSTLCDILFAMLPLSLLAPLPSPGFMPARTRVAPVASADDDRLRLRLAWHRERGGRLIYTQHGGEYGYVRSQLAYSAVEYRHQAFISWGWSQHGILPDGSHHVVPLPHPQLEAVRNKHAESSPVLLFVGTEMALIPYNLKSTRRTVQQFAYREDKAGFLAALSPKLLDRTLYRPYFDLPCTLADFSWVKARFSGLQRCTGPLEPHLFGCRLLVLDHLGTTLAQALAGNVPLIIVRNPVHQPVAEDCQPLLDLLATAGMLFEDPAAAAAQCESIWNNVGMWWNSDAVRKARKAFADLHACGREAPENLLLQWATALKKV